MSKNHLIRPSFRNKLFNNTYTKILEPKNDKILESINNKINYYIIHLSRYHERSNNIELFKKKINNNLNIFPAYDKINIIINEDNIYYNNMLLDIKFKSNISDLDYSENNKLNKGEIGCYISHYKLMEQLINSENQFSLILEDDAEIIGNIDLDKELQLILNKINCDFDLIYIGNLNNNYYKQYNDNIYYVNLKEHLTGTHAYLINNKNINKFHSYLKDMTSPIDIKLNNLIKTKIINAFVIYPYLIKQNMNIESTIRNLDMIRKRIILINKNNYNVNLKRKKIK